MNLEDRKMSEFINLNDTIVFNLTDLGKTHFDDVLLKEKEYYNFPKANTMNDFIQEDGSYKMRLHEFMFSFGKSFFNGAPSYIIDNSIKVDSCS